MSMKEGLRQFVESLPDDDLISKVSKEAEAAGFRTSVFTLIGQLLRSHPDAQAAREMTLWASSQAPSDDMEGFVLFMSQLSQHPKLVETLIEAILRIVILAANSYGSSEYGPLHRLVDQLPSSELQTAEHVLAALKEATSHQLTAEDRDWLESDLSRLGQVEPYDWGAAGLPPVKQVKYVPGLGIIVEEQA